MQPSPYTPGQLATTIPGRASQIEAMRERLGYVGQFSRFAGRIRVDVGPRGVGKTSLLRTMQAEANGIGFETVWITAGDGPFLVELINQFEKLAGSWKDKTSETLLTALKTLKVSMGGISLGTGMGGAPETLQGSASRALQDVVVSAGREVARRHHRGLGLFVDEIQSADADGLRALAYAWQHMQAEAPDLPAVAFTAGLSHSQDIITSAVSFGERFDYNHLDALDVTAAQSALVVPALDKGVRWGDDALAGALSLAGGYPYFIQLIGEHMWQAGGYPDTGAVLSAMHFQSAAIAFATAQRDLFRSRWAKASPAEAKLLTAMARLGDQPQRRADIAAELEVSTTALSMARSSLMDKGLIEGTNYGYLSFTAPGFGQFIRDQAGLE